MAVAPSSTPPPLEPVGPGPSAPTPAPVVTTPIYLQPQNPATTGSDLSVPAPQAIPATTDSNIGSTSRKFYTLTAELREIYDDNVGTTQNNRKSALETDLSPSVLVDFPDKNGDFQARYTPSFTYYSVSPRTAGNGSSGSTPNDSGELQITHEAVAQYSHAFSDRFNLTLAESFRYFIEPSIQQSTGTNYQDGAYITNILNGTFSAQWTPLVGTTTTYSNTVTRYDNSTVADFQNSVENTLSSSVGYAVLPKVTASLGGIFDDITYQMADRGYTSYTGFVGVSWAILPSITAVARGGGTYVEFSMQTAQIDPYADVTLNWQFGARSQLSFDYTHEVTPSGQAGANGQQSDRFTTSFNYLITPRLSAHLSGVFTHSTISEGLIENSATLGITTNTYNENVYSVDTGLTFHYDNHFDFSSGVTLSGVNSDISNDSYTRDEVYVGVRGTY